MKESNKTIGDIVAEDYRTSKVFEKYGIDFCCGGKIGLSAACKENKVDLATILGEIEEVKKTIPERNQNYASWELPFLIDYIVNVHHQLSQREYRARSRPTFEKIVAVHGERHSELSQISSIF